MIKMGDPEFKLRELIKRENVRVFSSNHALYGDLSRRVGDTLGSMVPTVETYSIDESFLKPGRVQQHGSGAPGARAARARPALGWHPYVCRNCANEDAGEGGEVYRKKRPQYRVCDLRSASTRAELLPTVPVDEVWGIGGASAGKLAKLGILMAADRYKVGRIISSSSCTPAPSTKTVLFEWSLGAVRHDNQRYRRSGGIGRAPGRTALARRFPLLEVRCDDYGAAARGSEATRLVE